MGTFAGRTRIEKARHKFGASSDDTHRRMCHTRTKIATLRNLPYPNIESTSFKETAEINARRRLQTSMYNWGFNESSYRNQSFAENPTTQQMTRAFWRTQRAANAEKIRALKRDRLSEYRRRNAQSRLSGRTTIARATQSTQSASSRSTTSRARTSNSTR
jgi:hypothetical protein